MLLLSTLLGIRGEISRRLDGFTAKQSIIRAVAVALAVGCRNAAVIF